MNQTTWQSRIIERLRRIRAFSATTPDLDEVDAWLSHQPRYFLGVLLAAPIVFFISGLRSLVLFRFGVLQSERIGSLAPGVGFYLLSSSRLDIRSRRIDFISVSRPVANLQLLVMLKRRVRILPNPWICLFLERACLFWTRTQVHRVGARNYVKHYPQIRENPEKLVFNGAEEQEGVFLLEALGIPVNAKWVCIHNRDSKYLATCVPAFKFAPGASWAYHSYRDFNVKSMLLAAEELADRGYYVLRMGAAVEEPLVSTKPRLIDYASTPFRSDFADIYLLARCAAYLGSDAGILGVPVIFGKPTLLVNLPFGYLHVITNITPDPFIPKHLSYRETRKLLCLREAYERGLGNVGELRKYDEAGVELICNTPEEIRDLAVELDERLKGIWRPDAEDERLQTRFWEIFRQYCPPDLVGGVQARIGSAFLRQNRYLLD